MSKCCCCLSVTTGAKILGLIGILLGAAELVPLVPYLIESDSFNPIEDNLERIFYVIEQVLEDHKFDNDSIVSIIETLRAYIWPAILGEAVSAGIFIFFAFLLLLGIHLQKRGLMLPYMIIQMTVTVIFIVIGLAATVGGFFLNIILGVVCGVVVMVTSFLLIYFWIVVQRAYVDIGMYANYSPAPTIKPIYTMSSNYPSAPHHFQMDEK